MLIISAVNTRSLDCTIRVAAVSRYIDLVTYAQDAVGVPEEPVIQASVIFSPDVVPMVGAFKMAQFGHTSLPIFKTHDSTTATSTKVCITQGAKAVSSYMKNLRNYLKKAQLVT
jgi:hypothetical protein